MFCTTRRSSTNPVGCLVMCDNDLSGRGCERVESRRVIRGNGGDARNARPSRQYIGKTIWSAAGWPECRRQSELRKRRLSARPFCFARFQGPLPKASARPRRTISRSASEQLITFVHDHECRCGESATATAHIGRLVVRNGSESSCEFRWGLIGIYSWQDAGYLIFWI
jgi:hypothetical protein